MSWESWSCRPRRSARWVVPPVTSAAGMLSGCLCSGLVLDGVVRALARELARLFPRGKTVFLLAENPECSVWVPSCGFRRGWSGGACRKSYRRCPPGRQAEAGHWRIGCPCWIVDSCEVNCIRGAKDGREWGCGVTAAKEDLRRSFAMSDWGVGEDSEARRWRGRVWGVSVSASWKRDGRALTCRVWRQEMANRIDAG